MISVKDLAIALLWEANQNGINICNLKLQKLIYYCQGYHLAMYKKPIFNSKIEAWKLGPVSPELYSEYKSFKNQTIPYEYFINGDSTYKKLGHSIKSVIDIVIDSVGRLSPNQLVNKTHRESPWKKHAEEGNADQQEIKHDELIKFFSEEVSVVQGNMVAEILDALDESEKNNPITIPKSAYESNEQMLEWIKSL